MNTGSVALSNMRRFIGVPYVFGGGRPLSMPNALTGTDCSGAVIASWEAAAPGSTGGATYTGNMRECFLSTGLWQEIEWWRDGGDVVQAGDVMIAGYDARLGYGHTAMASGTGTLVEEYPTQGQEVPWYNYGNGWDHCLRYVGGNDSGMEEVGDMTYVCVTDSVNVRTDPSLSAEVVASYSKGETVTLEADEILAEGYVWGMYRGAASGQARYVALYKVAKAEVYFDKE